MGNRSSSESLAIPDTLLLAMKAVGGDDGHAGYFGGARSDEAKKEAARDLREYESSLSAKAKERVIRGIAKALKRVGLPIDPDADPDTVIQAMVAALPRQRGKGGLSFTPDAAQHKQVCEFIAAALNDEFTPGASKPEDRFIDTSLSPQEVCRQVGEWTHSFAAGVNTEFLGVVASVRNILKSLQVLDGVMSELFQKISSQVDEKGDAKLAREVVPLAEVYRRAQKERQRQEELLKNLLDIKLPPDVKALDLAMREESDQYALIKKLGLEPGTGEFSDTLAAAVSGLGTAANVAHRVHKALKQVGISVREYLGSTELADLQKLIDARFQGATGDLAEFLQAANTVRSGFSNIHEQRFRDALEGADKTGGALDDQPSFGKKLESREAKKQVLVKSFSSLLGRAYGEMMAAIETLGPELGREVPLTDRTDRLNEALKRLKGHKDASQRIELALIGIYSDADARERKERFVSALRLVAQACDDIAEEAKSAALARLAEACRLVEKTVDRFSDEVRAKFGGADEATGGDAAELLAGAARNDLSLAEVVSRFLYLYYVARVRIHMAQSAKELEGLGKDYTDLLGDAVAARLDTLAAIKTDVLKYIAAQAAGHHPPFDQDWRAPAIKQWVVSEFDAKARFYNALQAIDLYLKAFAAGIAGDPDAARNIKKMLDGTQVIARWFSEKTGDSLWAAFESMDGIDYAARAKASGGNTAVLRDATSEHYYSKVANYLSTGGPTFGNPQAAIAVADTKGADRAADAQKRVEAVYDDFQALKNLVNAFARIGSEFGGQDIKSKVFLSPAQIYKALIDYLKRSALSINRGEGGAPVVEGIVASDMHTRFAAVPGAVGAWQVYFGAVRGAEGNYEVEDRLFVRAVKAMAAKILVTVGVYDMLERTGPLYDLTPTRMIVGGGDQEPEIITEAAELYFRLPRLVEYYQRLLGWEGDGKAEQKIALMPDIDGAFGGLLSAIFHRAADPRSGDYSDTELADIIREVNAVYERFARADKGRATQAAVAALIADVNQRYGIIKQQEAQDYWKLVRSSRSGTHAPETQTNFSILPGEDETDFARRAPSDRFRASAAGEASAATYKGLAVDGKIGADLLRAFRTGLDKDLDKGKAFVGAPFADQIRQAEAELKKTTDKSARLAIASRLILGAGSDGGSPEKLLMFHETVVFGLNALSAVTALLDNLDTSLAAMDPVTIEGAIADAAFEVNTGNFNGLRNQIRTRTPAYGVATDPAATIFDRYIRGSLPGELLEQRGGIDAAITVDRVYTLIGQVITLAQGATALGRPPIPSPSQITAEDPEKHSGGLLGHDAAANARRRAAVMGARLAARLLVRYDLIMRDLVDMLFSLGGEPGGLAEVTIDPGSTSNVRLSFTRLRSTVESVLSSVKKHLELLRPHVPAALIEQYEKKSNPGSVFWIEEMLVDKRLRRDDDKTKSLDGLARRAGQVFTNLTRITNVGLGPRVTAALIVDDPSRNVLGEPPVSGDPTRIESFGRAFAALLYYDALERPDPSGPGQTDDKGLGGYPLASLILNPLDRKGAPWSQTPKSAAGNALQRYELYSASGGFTQHRSAMMMLNQLIAGYLRTFTGTAAGERKIYTNLIAAFANGVASPAVQNPFGAGYPDMAETKVARHGARGDPEIGAVLCSSLASILRTLVSRPISDTNSVARHLYPQLLDVPLFMKETMRANLPGFSKLFRALSRKMDFIKHLMTRTSVDLGAPAMTRLRGGVDSVIMYGATDRLLADSKAFPENALRALSPFPDAAADGATRRQYLVGLATTIGGMSQALAATSDDVFRELGDQPVYFQTGENSIEQFRIQTGKMPTMPHSLVLWYLNNNKPAAPVNLTTGYQVASRWEDTRCPPLHSYGSAGFKVAYGTRSIILGGPISLDGLPFTKALLAQYNAASQAREQLEESALGAFVGKALDAIRFVVDVQQFRSILAADSAFGRARLVDAPGAGIQFAPGKSAPPAFALGADVSAADLISVVEDSEPGLAKKKVIARLGTAPGAGAPQGRAAECIESIIDMGVIPINVHALMKGIPIANVLNYEFTFEQMAAAMFGERDAFAEATDQAIGKTRQMFLALLSNPFREVPSRLYGSDLLQLGSAGFVHRIFRGDGALGMGRPKFLSDQIFNKALFGSVYAGSLDYDEGGPSVGIGSTRGREAVSRGRRVLDILRSVTRDMARLYAEWISPAVVGNASLGAEIKAAAAGNHARIRARAVQWYNSSLLHRIDAWSGMLHELVVSMADNAAIHAELKNAEDLFVAPAPGGALQPLIAAVRTEDAKAPAVDAKLDAVLAEFDGKVPNTVLYLLNETAYDGKLASLINGLPDAYASTRASSQPIQTAPGVAATQITYMKTAKSSPTEVEELSVGGHKAALEAIGKYRFDTKIVRLLCFIVGVQRLTRQKLNRELTQTRRVVQSAHLAVAPGTTEYGADPFDPNETFDSVLPNELARYSDQD